MKKIILFALFFGILLMIWSSAMAKKESGALSAPGDLKSVAGLDTDSICFSWDPVVDAVKYSLDVAVDVNQDGNTVVVEFSFNTADRTDGREPSDPDLCVPLSDFVFDLDGDGNPEQVSGTALVKVKALNPGKNNGRQNNAFSAAVEYTLGGPETPPDPLDPLFSR